MTDVLNAPESAASSPQTAPSKPTGMTGMSDAMGGLDKLAKLSSTETQQAPPVKRGVQPPPEARAAPVVEAVKPVEKAEAAVEVTAPASTEKRKPSDFLRDELSRWKTKAEALEKEYEEFKKKPAPDDTEKAELKKRFEETEKRYKETEDALRFTSYEKSGEYNEKYQKPIADAFVQAYHEIKQLEITDEEGNVRPATEDDFNSIARLSTAEAVRSAREKFGDGASEVLAHRRTIHSLNDQRVKALEEYKTHGAVREKQHAEQRQQQAAEFQGKMQSTFNSEYEGMTKATPDFFNPREGDAEGNALLEGGREEAAKAFDFSGKISPEEQARRHAKVWLKSAAFDRMARDNKKAHARIAELEAEVKSFSASEPTARGNGNPATATKPGGSQMDQAMSGLDRIGKAMRV